jgi:hypothetical protein
MKRSPQPSVSNTSKAKIPAKALQPAYTRTYTVMKDGHKQKLTFEKLREFLAENPRASFEIVPLGVRFRNPDKDLASLVKDVNSLRDEQRGADLPVNPFKHKMNLWAATTLMLLQSPQSRIFLKSLALADATKVSQCPVCTDLFVRKRKDQKCCCKKCANVHRVRKWRGKYPECYKPRRIARAESVEKEKPHVVPERKRKDLVVSLPVRRKDRSRIQPEPEPDRSARSRKAKASPARRVVEQHHPPDIAADIREGRY